MNDVKANLTNEARNSDTNHNHPPLFTLLDVCISYLQASWNKEALQQKSTGSRATAFCISNLALYWQLIHFISTSLLHNYNILLKSRRCMVRFLSLPAAPNLGDMQSQTSPATSISVHQGTQNCNCHIYCHVSPTSHNVLYYWRGGDKEMPLQTLPVLTEK